MAESEYKKPDGDTEQLMLLRAMTRETGILHDAQVFQLKIWSKAAFSLAFEEGLQDVEFAVGIHDDSKTKEKLRLVEFRVKATGKPRPPTKPLLEVLAKSVRGLLGDEYTVVAKLNGAAIFVDVPGQKPNCSLRGDIAKPGSRPSNRPSTRSNARAKSRRRRRK